VPATPDTPVERSRAGKIGLRLSFAVGFVLALAGLTTGVLAMVGSSPAALLSSGPEAIEVSMEPTQAATVPPASAGTSSTSTTPTPTTASPTTTASTSGSTSARTSTSTSPSSTAPGSSTGNATSAQAVLDQINRARAQHGRSALVMNAGLVAAADKHNLRMADGCGLSHRCPGEASLSSRISAEGVSWSTVGENVGWGGAVSANTSAITAMATRLTTDMLNETPPNDGHRQNILSSRFTRVGISVYRDSSGMVWMTQDFSG
jgi:uncharacterized protein YkwD